jgi:serine phosphatase RsbU (regulator of sigma subunit)
MAVSVRWKLFLALAVPILLGAAATAFAVGHWMRADALRRLGGELVDLGIVQAARAGERLAAVSGASRDAGALLSAGPGLNEQALRAVAQAQLARDPLVQALTVIAIPVAGAAGAPLALRAQPGAQGPVVARLASAREGPPGPLGEAYRQVRDARVSGWALPEPASDGEGPRLHYVLPLERGGALAGVLAVELAADRLLPLLGEGLGDHFRLVLVGPGNVFVAHPDPGLIGAQTVQGLARQLDWPDLLRLADRLAARAPGAQRLARTGDPGPHWAFYAPVAGTEWMIAGIAPEDVLLAPQRARERALAIGLAALAVALVTLTLLVSLAFVRPLRRVAAAAAELSTGLAGGRDPGRFGRDEVGAIGESLYLLGQALARHAERVGTRLGQEERHERLLSEGEARERACARLAQERDEQAREYRRVVRERDAHAVSLAALSGERDRLLARASEAERGLEERDTRDRRQALVHRRLLADTVPAPVRTRDLQLAGALAPALQPLGSFVDWLVRVDGRVVLMSGDCSRGQGVTPAVAALVREALRRLAGEGGSPGSMLAAASRLLAEAGGGRLSLGVFLAVYGPELGELTYANAAHRPPLSVDRTGAVHPLGRSQGPPLGEATNGTYPEGIANLVGGETLVLVAGGLPPGPGAADLADREAGLAGLLASHAGASAEGLVGVVLEAGAGPHARPEPSDDAAVLVLHRPAGWAGGDRGGAPGASGWRRLVPFGGRTGRGGQR